VGSGWARLVCRQGAHVRARPAPCCRHPCSGGRGARGSPSCALAASPLSGRRRRAELAGAASRWRELIERRSGFARCCQPAPDRPVWQWAAPTGGRRESRDRAGTARDALHDRRRRALGAVQPDAEALTYGGCVDLGQWQRPDPAGSRGVWPRLGLGAATGWRSWTRTTRPPEVALGAGCSARPAPWSTGGWRRRTGLRDQRLGASLLFAGADLLPAVEASGTGCPASPDVITVGGRTTATRPSSPRPAADRDRYVTGETCGW